MTDELTAKRLLEATGWLPASGASVQDKAQALARYQRTFGLLSTGALDEVTRAKVLDLRCTVSDYGRPPGRKTASYATSACKWPKKELTYAFLGYLAHLEPAQVKMAMRRACDDWESVCGLSFTETSDPTLADITVDFIAQDGPGKTLGWAGFPGSCGGVYAGKIRLDQAEAWTAEVGSNLQGTLAHELGHAIGIDHSLIEGTLMYAYATGGSETVQDDDAEAAQSLYGLPPDTGDTVPIPDPLIFTRVAEVGGRLRESGPRRHFMLTAGQVSVLRQDGFQRVRVRLQAGEGVDFDAYARWGDAPVVSGDFLSSDVYDFSGTSPRGSESFDIPLDRAQVLWIMVYSYHGEGGFKLLVEPLP